MELPIDDKELSTIVSALRLGGDSALYQKLKLMKDIREQYPGGAYKMEKLSSVLLSSRTSLMLTLMVIVYILTLKPLLTSLLSQVVGST